MAVPTSHMWYVKAAGGVWGPYPETRVHAFVAEGRVGPETPLSPWLEGPFGPAAANAEFAALFQPRRAPPPEPPQPAAAVARSGGAAQYATAAQAALQAASPQSAVVQSAVAQSAFVKSAMVQPVAVQPQPAALEAAPLRPLLVWAQLSARSSPGFQSALTSSGAGVTIRPGLWLVQGRMGAAALRNLLSRTLGDGDALLVVEASLDQAAWFNLDPARDRELRRLWSA